MLWKYVASFTDEIREKTTKKDHDTQRYRTDVLNGIIAESGKNVLRVCRDIQRVMYKCDAPVSL